MSDCRFGISPVNYPDPVPDPEVFNRSERTLMLVTVNISGRCRWRMAVRYISCPVFILDM